MNEKQESWRPRPASKPSHLSTPKLNPPSSALQGATSAFGNKSANVSPTSAARDSIAKLAATSAGGDVHRDHTNADGTKSSDRDGRQSPSRGRIPLPKAVLASDKPNAYLLIPQDMRQLTSLNSPSAIAAKIASASSSPVRNGPSTSPQRIRQFNKSPVPRGKEDLGVSGQNVQSASQTSTSFASSQQADMSGVRSRMLTFERIPTLAPPKPVSVPRTQLSGLSAARQAYQSSPPRVAGPLPSVLNEQRVPSSRPSPKRANTSQGVVSTEDTKKQTEEHGRVRPEAQLKVQAPPPIPAPRRGAGPSRVSPNLDTIQGFSFEDSQKVSALADAMVASSLASTRASSPVKTTNSSSSRRRRSASVSEVERIRQPPQASTQHASQRPARHMKQTLRKATSDTDDEVELVKRGHRHLVRKHPNMHSEADRKRWRDKVTERERRRFEGVFAANRGRLLQTALATSPSRLADPNSEGNLVVNIVVRDIWERSRLPKDILEEVYDLVAPEQPLCLNREQFVVGLWLIDQRLKGRKLPVKVSGSVWASVRHAHGIKIRGKIS